jgi:uncharacterized protein (DUF58 family)
MELRSGWEKNLLSRSNGVVAGSQHSGTADGEFFGLREWQSGDNPRWIHWRTTARIGELAVRQFEQHRRFDMCVMIDGFDPAPTADSVSDADSDSELAISLAATVIVRLAGQPANRVSLAVAGTQAAVSGNDQSAESQMLMLRHLSELQTSGSPMLLSAIDQLAKSVGIAHDLIVISPRSFAEASAVIEAEIGSSGLEKRLAPWIARNTLRWLDVRQPDVTNWMGRPSTGQHLSEGVS